MPDDLAQENKQLRRNLAAFVGQAKENEKKLQRFADQELDFISADGLEELLNVLFDQYRVNFNLDALSLLLIDTDYEITRITDKLQLNARYPDLLLFPSIDVLAEIVPTSLTPRLLQSGQPSYLETIFPNTVASLASIGIFPIIRNRQLLGTLNLGSCDESRFRPGSATDFLERMATIIAVCIENALNHERIKQLGLIDPLTAIHNRRYFDQRLEEEVTRCHRQEQPLSCLYLDIDFFKSINDKFGHQAGDRVLQTLGKLFAKQMRQSDILARLGGEEFSILLVNTERHKALEIAERIRKLVEQHAFAISSNKPLNITISIGCATMTGNEKENTSPQELLKQADLALYNAKSSGRNRVVY